MFSVQILIQASQEPKGESWRGKVIPKNGEEEPEEKDGEEEEPEEGELHLIFL